MLKIEKKGAGTNFNVNGYDATTEDTLLRELEKLVHEGKSEMILDIGPGVEFNAYTIAVDKATIARVSKILTKNVLKKPTNRNAAPTKTTPAPTK